MSWKRIGFASEEGIATVTVNRPDKLNALDGDALEELGQAFLLAGRDEAVRGLLLTGAGEKAFAAGADIAELARLTPLEAQAKSAEGQRIFGLLESMGKPSVAAINGYALGAGLELAMCCGIRVASENATLGLPEVKLGLIPGYGGTQRLAQLVGRGRALEMLLTGDPIDAREAHRMGLVNHVAPQSELLGFCRGLLRKMTENAPAAAALILQAVETGLSSGREAGLRFESAAFGLAAATEDRAEGARAFLEKRKARFTGK